MVKTDLCICPIFHWTVPRIKARMAMCFMAFSLVHFLGHRLSGSKNCLSPERIQEALLNWPCTILRDEKTDKRYVLSTKPTKEVESMYKATGVTMATTTDRLEKGRSRGKGVTT